MRMYSYEFGGKEVNIVTHDDDYIYTTCTVVKQQNIISIKKLDR
jgi:hypothetical protein